MGFEVIGGEVAEGRVPPFSIVIGEVMADFQACLGYVAEAAAGEQFSFEPTLKRLGVGVIVAVIPPAHALQRRVAGY